MSRYVPYPFSSFSLFVLSLLLASDLSGGTILLSMAVAVVIPPLLRPFQPDLPAIKKPLEVLKLACVVWFDIMVANFQVAYQVLGPLKRLQPDFVDVPIDIEDPFVATILASIVSLTPGTVSIDIDLETNVLLVHALHVPDKDDMIGVIKDRYESRLKRIFGC